MSVLKFLFGNFKSLLSCILIFLGHTSVAIPLSGSFTIGGNSPDYTDIGSAVNDLNTNGVSGNVVFNIRAGTYNENIRINELSGSGPNAIVTFQSESGTAKDVVITHTHLSSSTNYNYTIYLDGTDFIIFKELTIQADPLTSSSFNYNRVIYITGNSNNVTFKKNIIRSWRVSSGSAKPNSCIFIGSDYNTSYDNDSIVFFGNQIYGGYNGIYFQGSSSAGDYQAQGGKYVSNSFFNQTYNGLEIVIAKNTLVKGNHIRSDPKYGSYGGIKINQHSDSLLLTGNTLEMNRSLYGLDVSGVVPGTTDYMIVSNNCISIGPETGPSTVYGIQSNYNRGVLYAFNSVIIFSKPTSSSSFYSNNNDTIQLFNNQLVNKGAGYCYYVRANLNNDLRSDHNNLFTTGANLAYDNGTDWNTIDAIRGSTYNDSHSLAVDPRFISNTFLIPYNDSVFGAGILMNKVQEDFFGTSRPAKPTIGYYEGYPTDNDAAIVSSSSNDVLICPNDSFNIYVDVTNLGNQVLTKASIYYSVNNSISSAISWTGNLDKFEVDSNVFLGSLTTDTLATIRIWIIDPNGKQDEFVLNDTFTLNSRLAFKGNYRIGGTSSDFNTLGEAIQAIAIYGACGPVVFNIAPGIYDEQVTIPEIEGLSDTNVLSIQSATRNHSDVKFQYTSTSSINNFIFKIEHTDHVKINHLSFEPKGNNYSTAIFIEYGSNNTIDSNYFIGVPRSSSNNHYYSLVRIVGNRVYSAGNNLISGNTFVNGGNQVSVIGDRYYPELDNRIIGNRFTGTGGRCIYAEGQKNLTAYNNTLKGKRYSYNGGIYLRYCEGGGLINANRAALENNTPNLIMFDQCNVFDSVPFIVMNNFLSAFGTSYACCIRFDNTKHLSVYNNSCFTKGDKANVIQWGLKNEDIRIINNILYDDNEGKMLFSLAPFDTSQIFLDHNVYFTKDTSPFEFERIPYSLMQYQNMYKVDSNSIFTEPNFTSDTNLYVDNAIEFNGAGVALDEVKYDIDGTLRADPPDIGAVEFEIDTNTLRDIELKGVLYYNADTCMKQDSVIIEVTNHSIFQIDSFELVWTIYKTTIRSGFIHQAIPAGATIRVNLGPYDFAPLTIYDMEMVLLNPNGAYDHYKVNNTMQYDYYHFEDFEIFQYKDPCIEEIELYIKGFPFRNTSWSTGSKEIRTYIKSPGTYSITVEGLNGCKATRSIIIN